MVKYIVLIILTTMLISCDDGCKDGETQCNGTKEQICADNNWMFVRDCDEIISFIYPERKWICCEYEDGGAGCDLPQNCN